MEEERAGGGGEGRDGGKGKEVGEEGGVGNGPGNGITLTGMVADGQGVTVTPYP